MPKFSAKSVRPRVRGPIVSTDPVLTKEGGVGTLRDPESELFLLGVSNLVGEDTFYEKASARDRRYAELVASVEPDWVRRFLPWLRTEARLRSAPLVGAAHYVAAGGEQGRALVNQVLARPDEPAELLAFWHQTYGRKLPAAMKRGIADAVGRLYTQRSALKYDGTGKAWRMGDVIELVHPSPRDAEQSALFRYLLDRKAGRDDPHTEGLDLIEHRRRLEALPQDQRTLEGLDDAVTWEWLSGWLGRMDAAAWEAVIPKMGAFALARNLRNFEEAGIGPDATAIVQGRLSDPAEIEKSRMLPIRLYMAWQESGSMTYASALEQAVTHTVTNVPVLAGRTLTLVDLSRSMNSPVSGRSRVTNARVASLFGSALMHRNDGDLYGYSNQLVKVTDRRLSVLRIAEGLHDAIPHGGTETARAVLHTYSGHDRVVVITDEQAHYGPDLSQIPVPIYTFNVSGYRAGWHAESRDRVTIGGGLTDAAFGVLGALEAGKDGDWPF